MAMFALAGCAAGSSDNASASVGADESSGGPAAGEYRVVEDPNTLSGLWLDDVDLNADGTFAGTLGSDVSNLSGHEFSSAGHYAFHTFTAGPSLVFNDNGTAQNAFGGVYEFTFETQADGTLKVRTLNSEPSLQTHFTLARVLTPDTKAPPPGHYEVVNDTQLSGLWIDDVTLSADGTFKGTFGSDVSNLSGHEFGSAGHYAFHTFTAGPSLVFTDNGTAQNAFGGVYQFTFQTQLDGSLSVRTLDSDASFQTKFTLKASH
jgi:hypothetical protein